MNVSLGEKWEAFITERVESGRYMSASEVVREGLRLVEGREYLRERKLEELRKEIQLGVAAMENGDYEEFDEAGLKAFVERIKSEGRRELIEEQKKSA